MRHVKAKKTLEVPLEPLILAVLVVLVARARFEQEHRQTSRQKSCQLVGGGLFANVIDLPNPVRQVGEVLVDGGEHFKHQLPFF